MLIVAPKGIDTEYVSSSNPNSLASSMLTGMLAAEERVKNAVMNEPFKHLNTSGNGFCFVQRNTMIGLVTNITTNIDPTNTPRSFP